MISPLAYNYLVFRQMPPFKGKVLFDADDVEFRVTRHQDCHGLFDDRDRKGLPIIAISEVHVKTPLQLLETMAHEMVHMVLYKRSHSKWNAHGPSFKAFSKRVCSAFGFNLETF